MMEFCFVHTFILNPREQPIHTLSVLAISHARALNRNSLLVSAPTGQTSMTFIEYALSRLLPGKVSIVTRSPRFTNVSCGSPTTSEQNRMHREQEIQRSPSNMTCGPSST